MYENFIYSELVKSKIFPKYWHTKSGAEVDFIMEKENKLIPIEIKSLLKKTVVTKSFFSFVDKYKPKKGYVLSLDFEDTKKIQKCAILFLPFLKFINDLNK